MLNVVEEPFLEDFGLMRFENVDFSRQFLLALRLYALLNLLGLFPICSLGLGAASLALGTLAPTTRSIFLLIFWRLALLNCVISGLSVAFPELPALGSDVGRLCVTAVDTVSVFSVIFYILFSCI